MTPFSPARNFPQNKSKTFRCEFRFFSVSANFDCCRRVELVNLKRHKSWCITQCVGAVSTIVSQLIAQTRPLFQDASVGDWAVHVREELQKANDSAHRGQGE